MSSDYRAAPFNPLPPMVTALAAAMVLVELIFQAGARGLAGGPQAVGWRIDALNRFAFSPDLFERMAMTGQWPLDQVARLVTYPFVHLDFTHVLFVVVFLLALGKMVAEVFHPAAFLAVFFGSAISGALVYTLALDDPTALIGGFPAVYGLIGAYTFLLWVGLGAMGENRMRAFTLIGFLLGIQLLFGLLFGASNQWVAELAGFATGFGLSFVVSPGGWSRAVAKLRQR
ncbi:rhomboid family intramembrane serine protease [Tranquillimonas alkanivorans]|uniref:Membrane associated serine protease, rhomboid family n=1 Tax=Tranquillimonas alkanivorans TaxID=441119 RepID=A0A1I5TZK4_9RHOB|nr:rhomboid family intramembrane serine protease [Tranquillimonas alkanivorans]SFP88057.1 Membrane associated serine protease, rhomboid family [Tranquillimonas alkanivorans]